MSLPLVVAINMGYGHLRAAHALAARIGTDVLDCDRPPLAGEDEQRLWSEARRLYEASSRISQLPLVGAPLRLGLDALTSIPHLHPRRDLSAPNHSVKVLARYGKKGLGHGLVERLQKSHETILCTFFAPAVLADRAGCERIFCLVTDADAHRIWAPAEPRSSGIVFLAPSARVVRRLAAYGVPPRQIRYTGYPLPDELVGGPDLPLLRRNLASRLSRLDPRRTFRDSYGSELEHFLGALPSPAAPPSAREDDRAPPHLVFAVGGAGAQVGIVRALLPSVRDLLRGGRLRLTLIAGVRREVEREFNRAVEHSRLTNELGRSLAIVAAPDVPTYLSRFNQTLKSADVLWTKPSELTFFAALGLPIVFAPPIGMHERYNRRWAVEQGAGLKQRDPAVAGEWLSDWLEDGTLAGAAWCGFMRLPKFGLYRILDELSLERTDARRSPAA